MLVLGCGDDDDQADEPAAQSSATANNSAPAGSEATTAGSAGGGDAESCTLDRAGGDITVLTGVAATGLDPVQPMLMGTGAYGGDVAGAFYGGVIRYNAATEEYEPFIAKSWDSNDEHTVWTLTLRDDVTFGNGDPFTAADVAAHIRRLQDSSMRSAGMVNLISDIEIVNDQRMVVTLESPFDFRYMMASEPGWVPNADLVEERGDRFTVNPVGAGAGAFEFGSMSTTPGESLVLTAKDDWWGGVVCLESIDFQYVPETTAQTDAFLNGEADSLFVIDQVQEATLDEQGLMAYQVPVGMLGYITANQGYDGEETIFDDVRIREAMQLAVNYEALHQRIHDGRGTEPTSALLPEGSPLASGVEGPPYDPERAKELVEETVADGVWDGSFTLTHDPTGVFQESAIALKAMWEAVGMDVTLESATDAVTRVTAGDYQVSYQGFSILPPAPWSTLNSLECDSPRTRSGFCDPDMDAALDQLKQAVSMDEQRAAMAEVQEVWNQTFPLVGWRHGTWGIAAQPNLHGLEVGADVTPYYEGAWVEQ